VAFFERFKPLGLMSAFAGKADIRNKLFNLPNSQTDFRREIRSKIFGW